MTSARRTIRTLICTLIISAGQILAAVPAMAAVNLHVDDGRVVIDGVYVNGHGPYRFLVDTGSNVNLIETGLARKIGMSATFQVELATAAGSALTSGSDGNEVRLDSVNAGNQKFLFSSLDAIHNSLPGVRGVLGQWFLARFDYTINLQARQLEFGKQDLPGARTPFRMINARTIISTSLGDLVLDSGQTRLVLFGVEPESDLAYQLRTVAGSRFVGKVEGKPLLISGRKFSNGEAIAVPNRPEPGVDGLLPLGLFHSIYVSNTEEYVIFD